MQFTNRSENLLIDCDPGVDDAIALLLAFGSPELNLLGITTVGGNVPVQQTQTNARQICTLAKVWDVPVAAGCGRPMVLAQGVTAEYIHGETGLGRITFLPPQIEVHPQHGVDFLIQTLMESTELITLATLGPLTNLAIALVKQPEIRSKIKSLVIMGGATTFGNVTPSAEFNFYCDPHAAKVVFESGLPIVMIGLDVTHQAIATRERLTAIRSIGGPIGIIVAQLLHDYSQHDMQQYGFAGAPLHDPCVIAYLIDPTLFELRSCFVEIDITEGTGRGRSIVDWYGISGKPVNAEVATSIDSDRFYQLLCDRLSVIQNRLR